MTRISDSLSNHVVWARLSRIQKILGLSDLELADRLGYTSREFQKKRATFKPLLAAPLARLSADLKIDLQKWVFGNFDFAAFEQQIQGNSLYLPEVYTQGAFSRRRTSQHLVSYCDQFYGSDFADSILAELQVTRAALAQVDEFISIRFLTDLTHSLTRRGATDFELRQMGAQASRVNAGSPLGKVLGKSRSVQEAYDHQINGLVGHYDLNFRYRLTSLTSTSCTIESTDRDTVQDALRTRRLGSHAVCQTRIGVAAAVTGYLGFPPALTTHPKCRHRGDVVCQFHVEYGDIQRLLRRRESPVRIAVP